MKLEGIKVLDLSMFLPGPHLTMMMADHGAEVIRIEPPSGEPTRVIGARQAGASSGGRNRQLKGNMLRVMSIAARAADHGGRECA